MVNQTFRIVFSKKAKQRLREISNYYSQTVSKSLAKKIRQGIVNAAKELKKSPDSKTILPNTDSLDYTVRYTKTWSFKVIFRIHQSGKLVSILTIRHDRESPEKVQKDIS